MLPRIFLPIQSTWRIMAKTETLLDTGVIVGLLHKHDQHHEWAKRQFDRVSAPFYTCEAVLSEAFHLLEGVPTGPERLLSVLERGIFDLSFSYARHTGRVHERMRTYAPISPCPSPTPVSCAWRRGADVRRSLLSTPTSASTARATESHSTCSRPARDKPGTR